MDERGQTTGWEMGRSEAKRQWRSELQPDLVSKQQWIAAPHVRAAEHAQFLGLHENERAGIDRHAAFHQHAGAAHVHHTNAFAPVPAFFVLPRNPEFADSAEAAIVSVVSAGGAAR